MMKSRLVLGSFMAVAALTAIATPAAAQNWSGDARRIAMGGVGSGENLASKSVQEENDYRSIVLPLGLIQVFKDIDIFDPGSDKFDIVRSFEYALSPLHYTLGRDGSNSAVQFVNDIRNAQLNRDLNTYRGFVPVSQPVGYGLANPNWGVTLPVYKTKSVRHGVYVGAGPYLAMRGDLTVDQRLADVLSSNTDVYLPSTQIPMSSDARGEAAVALTGGYRGHFAWPTGVGSGADRDGLYVAVNYSYLRGFHMEDGYTSLRLDTDAAGLLTVNQSLGNPVTMLRTSATEGQGRVIDLGVAAVVNNWEFGFGVNGVANQIRWTNVEGTAYGLGNLFLGGEFVESVGTPMADMTIKQPVEYTGNVGYRTGPWSLVGQLSQRTSDYAPDEDRLNTTTVRAGVEYRFLMIEPRAGAYYTRERWQPAAGVGLNFGGFGIDTAVYTTDTNVERHRHATFALSLRFGGKQP